MKTVKKQVEESMKVFKTKKELREFLGILHYNTLETYIRNDSMPFDLRFKMQKETNRRIELLSE